MKLKTTLFLALFAGVYSASAFSLDFTGFDGNTVTFEDRQVVEATPDVGEAPFGDVDFGVREKDAPATIGTVFGPVALQFDDTQVIEVRFFGGPVQDFMVSFVGVGVGETTSFELVDATTGRITISGSGSDPAQAGITGITFQNAEKIPEPSTALLGCLGALALLRRRR